MRQAIVLPPLLLRSRRKGQGGQQTESQTAVCARFWTRLALGWRRGADSRETILKNATRTSCCLRLALAAGGYQRAEKIAEADVLHGGASRWTRPQETLNRGQSGQDLLCVQGGSAESERGVGRARGSTRVEPDFTQNQREKRSCSKQEGRFCG
jgi:hypothetical protein